MSQQNTFSHFSSSHHHYTNPTASIGMPGTSSNASNSLNPNMPLFGFSQQQQDYDAVNFMMSQGMQGAMQDTQNMQQSQIAQQSHMPQMQNFGGMGYGGDNAYDAGMGMQQQASQQQFNTQQQSAIDLTASPPGKRHPSSQKQLAAVRPPSQSSNPATPTTVSTPEEDTPFPYTDAQIKPVITAIIARSIDEFHQKNGKRMAYRTCPICHDSIGTNGGNFKKHCFTDCDYIANLLSEASNGDYFGSKKKVEEAAGTAAKQLPDDPPTKEYCAQVTAKVKEHFTNLKKKNRKRKRDTSPTKPKKKKSPKTSKSTPRDDTVPSTSTSGTVSGEFTAYSNPPGITSNTQQNSAESQLFRSMYNGSFVRSLIEQSPFMKAGGTKTTKELNEDFNILVKGFHSVRSVSTEKIIPSYIHLRRKQMAAQQQQQ